MRNRSCYLLLLALAGTAHAQDDEAQQPEPSSSPLPAATAPGAYFGLGIGPAVQIEKWPSQFRLEEDIGYFTDNAPRGFFIAFTASQGFGNSFYTFTWGPRFGYFFDLFRRDVTFQIAPVGTIDFALAGCMNGPCGADAYFHFSFSIAGRLLLLEERLAIYVRPLEFEFGIGQVGTVRYVLVAGAQYAF